MASVIIASMLAIPYLLLSFLAALVLVQRLFHEFPTLVRMVAAFAVSIILTGWVNFFSGWLIHSLGRDDATFYGAFVTMVVNAVIVAVLWRELRPVSFRIQPLEMLGTSAALALSFWVMHQRLSDDPLMVSFNTWGDTALHIGIARSFSQGDNYPPVLPIFAEQTIRYHFGFDFYVGVLERLGLPIAWGFNLLGALGFAGIMMLLFALVQRLWGRMSIGIVVVILFMTNSSLAFLRYFDRYPSVIEALKPHNWWQHDTYLAGGGYQPGEQIALFWTPEPRLSDPDPSHYLDGDRLVRRLRRPVALTRTRWHRRGSPGGLRRAEPPSAASLAPGGRARDCLWRLLLAQTGSCSRCR